ncbi:MULTISPECIES: lipoyl(octanoyl) transferase LipB [Methylomicrobium]|uniref:Octanoyltransferase n=1 Tax=Methylomicrobium album BG8 TaxID=686340 RepID=H8GQE5_METAL|nr:MULTISPECIES: lipoyl(octanoyl) transferase LipB [Methylomicrobium]EIC28604.1 lipoate-protein ligase B [Methylomicrobium album BG8]
MAITIRQLGLQDYETVWQAMQCFTLDRTPETGDQIWIVEHQPVYTLGLNGKREHLLNTGPIPVVQSDRGGQVTYHGPGQLVVYPLLNLKRRELGVRPLVTLLEQTMIAVLAHYGIHALARPEAPGVYVEGKKIGSIGIRIRNNCCYHGLSLNNAMDLAPFKFINPCGYAGLEVTQLADLGVAVDLDELAERLLQILTEKLPS